MDQQAARSLRRWEVASSCAFILNLCIAVVLITVMLNSESSRLPKINTLFIVYLISLVIALYTGYKARLTGKSR